MWWDAFVPTVVMEERLRDLATQMTCQVEQKAAEVAALEARLREIEESAGWKFVLWCRQRFARALPSDGRLAPVHRLVRRAFRIWLDRGVLSLSAAVARKATLKLARRLRLVPAALPVPAAPPEPEAPAPAPPPAAAQVILALPAPAPPPPPVGGDPFHLYSSSLGNYFFHEMRDLLAAGLEELGLKVERRTEKDGFAPGGGWHVVMAPHEFFVLGAGQELAAQPLPKRLILINTEQPSTQWFQLAASFFPKAHAIWDIDYLSSQRLRHAGWKCYYLPLGYVPEFPLFKKVVDLPFHYGTCFLEKPIRSRPPHAEPLADRPIDVAFFGTLTPRRQSFLAAASPVLARYNCYLHLMDASRPLLPGQTTFMDTATVTGLVQRSKILLNIHRDNDLYFEWHRIVLLGIWHRPLVVSERCSPALPFRAGVDYVEAPLDDLPSALDYYLADPQGRQEAQSIAEEGFRTLTRDCRMRHMLRPVIAALGQDALPGDRAPAVSERVRSAA